MMQQFIIQDDVMRILNRPISLAEIPSKAAMFFLLAVRTITLFKRPIRLLAHYIGSKPLPEKYLEFKDGRKIFLSNYPHDLITIMVVCSKREYGDVPKNAIVLDVGANIGAFCLFAKLNGACRVVAFEPNPEAFDILQKNIRENGFQESITAVNVAVSDMDDSLVWISQDSDPNNHIVDQEKNSQENSIRVKTISLKSLLLQYSLDHVDLMKVDCEGAEYKIIESSDEYSYNRIESMRFEYHGGADRLTNHLLKFGFRIKEYFPDNERVGRIFYGKN